VFAAKSLAQSLRDYSLANLDPAVLERVEQAYWLRHCCDLRALISAVIGPDKCFELSKKKSKPTSASATTPVVELIVRRGALDRFDKLRRDTKDLPVKLSWDRRLHQRRSGSSGIHGEQRQADRRKQPPFTWEVADFVAVEVGDSALEAKKNR
jgi:hypothetical protein